ncbi:MAG: ribonuclease E inhibitor RraB [Pseudorhodoplanes sp.]
MSDRSHASRDEEVRAALAQHGDDGTAPRHTLFYFYGGNFKALGAAATKAGYDVRSTANNAGVILETTTAVDPADFSPHAAQMEKWADAFDSVYDGWECQVVKR